MTLLFRPATLLIAGVALWCVIGLRFVLAAPPLGHDEAQYAVVARDALRGAPERWAYVSKGMLALAAPGVLAGGSEVALRMFPWVMGIVFIAAVAFLASRAFSGGVAAWSVAVIVTAKPIVRFSADLLSDLPATAMLLLATALLLAEVTRDGGPRWRITLSAPLFAAAFYLRYASCVPIAVVGVVAIVVGWRALWSRPLPAVVALLLFLALLVPHALEAEEFSGSPLGILLVSQTIPQSSISGLETYLTSNPFRFYGLMLAPVAMIGLLTPVWSRDRRGLALWAIAVLDIVALGLTALGQFRYIFFAGAVLVILGIEALRRALRLAPPRLATAMVGAGAAALALGAAMAVVSVAKLPVHRRAAFQPAMTCATVVRKDAAGKACHVVATHYTQLEWYSGCNGFFVPDDAMQKGESIYYIRDRHDDPRVFPAEPPGPSVEVFRDDSLQVMIRKLVPPG